MSIETSKKKTPHLHLLLSRLQSGTASWEGCFCCWIIRDMTCSPYKARSVQSRVGRWMDAMGTRTRPQYLVSRMWVIIAEVESTAEGMTPLRLAEGTPSSDEVSSLGAATGLDFFAVCLPWWTWAWASRKAWKTWKTWKTWWTKRKHSISWAGFP